MSAIHIGKRGLLVSSLPPVRCAICGVAAVDVDGESCLECLHGQASNAPNFHMANGERLASALVDALNRCSALASELKRIHSETAALRAKVDELTAIIAHKEAQQ